MSQRKSPITLGAVTLLLLGAAISGGGYAWFSVEKSQLTFFEQEAARRGTGMWVVPPQYLRGLPPGTSLADLPMLTDAHRIEKLELQQKSEQASKRMAMSRWMMLSGAVPAALGLILIALNQVHAADSDPTPDKEPKE